MTKLYHTESGHSMPNLAEELTTFRRAHKVLTIPPTASPAVLYFLARAHEGTKLPLHISVNGTALPPVPPQEAWHTWYEVPIDFGLLQAGDNVLEFWTDSTAMNSWALGLEAGHADPNSYVSDDSGRAWRNHHMAYLNVVRAEYVVRIRLAEGNDPTPPPMVFNDPDDPRLESLRAIMPAKALDQSLPKLERLRAISTWLASSWEHTPAGPDLGVINSPWDPETVLAWAPGQCGHNGLRPTANCIFYGVAFANSAQAIGVPARCAIFAGKPGKADGHFTAEYWSDEHQKWAMVDPNFDDFFIHDGVPLSISELQKLGSDLDDVTARGPGAESQRTNQRVHRWFDSHDRRARSFESRMVWYRADQLTRPEFSPPAHGAGGAYTETGIVWEERDKDTWPMFPHFGSKDYFNAPPIWEG
ncbi:MAG: hypothetical protein OXD46_05045 [Chloroflexi bacterium]|nr:hypothetical protein [Chloroflexota bacterium]